MNNSNANFQYQVSTTNWHLPRGVFHLPLRRLILVLLQLLTFNMP